MHVIGLLGPKGLPSKASKNNSTLFMADPRGPWNTALQRALLVQASSSTNFEFLKALGWHHGMALALRDGIMWHGCGSTTTNANARLAHSNKPQPK